MRTARKRWAALAVAVAVALAGCGGDDDDTEEAGTTTTAAEASAAAQELRESLPTPDEDRPASLTTYVGTDESRRFGVALVLGDDGAVVAYACDGQDVGRWFGGSAEGDEVDLPGRAGARIEASIGEEEATGTLTIDGEPLPITLAPARRSAGLFRHVESDGGEEAEAGWVVTNDASIWGILSSSSGTTLFSAQADSSELPSSGSGTTGTTSTTSGEQALLFKRVRCFFLKRKITALQEDAFNGTISLDEQEAMDEASAEFDRLGCS